VWLPVDIAAESAVVFGGMSAVVSRTQRPKLVATLPILRESAILLVIYAAWRKLGDLPVFGVDRAFSRAEDLWRWQRTLHLPNEATMQRWLAHIPVLLRFANVYYIVFHVAPLGIFLVWLFFRHRQQYSVWRNILAGASLACMLIQTIPVAPPRMFPQFGFIDAGQVYGPRVYDPADSSLSGQLAAMPSMHVLWAVLIGVAVMSVTRSRWRWLGLAHAVLTVYAVTVTGYHWLADSIVGAALVGAGVLVAKIVERRRLRRGALGLGAVGEIPVDCAA
jgi:PAP2 superfamily